MEAAVEALRKASVVAKEAAEHPAKRRDLQDIVGSWVADPETDRALVDQRSSAHL